MRTAPDTPSRPAFTLIEMLVVIGLMLVLLVLTALFLPGLQGNQKVQTGVDRLSQWLLIAKQRAKHDGMPTGLRLVIDPNTNFASQFYYVQQPDFMFGDPSANVTNSCFTQPVTVNAQTTYPASTTVLFPPNMDFTGGDATNPLVQPGDYLELFGGGALYSIVSTGSVTIPLGGPPPTPTPLMAVNLNPLYPPGVSLPTATTSWRIIRGPRRVAGEDVLTLPQDVVVDLNTIPNATFSYSQNVPTRSVPIPGNPVTYYEILFSPSGAVIGQVASSGKVLLWVRDSTVTPPSKGDAPPMQGNPSLVSVQVRTGFIGSYPVVPNTDPKQYPYQFYSAALQGRSGF